MSTSPSSDPRNEAARQSDEDLLSSHASAEGKGSVVNPAMVFMVIFAFLLCFAGVYLDRNAGDYSVMSFNEDAHAGSGPVKPKAVNMVEFGKKQYLAACVTCHQPTGAGLPGTYPPLAGSEWVTGSEEHLIRIVLHGLNGPVKVAGVQFTGAVQMPAFSPIPGGGYNWRDDQIAAVLTYVRQEWGNKAPAITTEKVAEIRTKENRTKAWTVEELETIK